MDALSLCTDQVHHLGRHVFVCVVQYGIVIVRILLSCETHFEGIPSMLFLMVTAEAKLQPSLLLEQSLTPLQGIVQYFLFTIYIHQYFLIPWDSLYWAECWQEEVWITGLKVRKGCNVLNIAHSLWSWRCKKPCWVVVVITAFDAIPVVSCCHEPANQTFTTRLYLHIHLTLFIKDIVCPFWDNTVVLGMMMSQGQQSRKCSHSFSPT